MAQVDFIVLMKMWYNSDCLGLRFDGDIFVPNQILRGKRAIVTSGYPPVNLSNLRSSDGSFALENNMLDGYIKQPIPEALRQFVFERDGYICRYCGSRKPPFHADHVYPESKGGETTGDNLVTSCSECNARKYNKIGVWSSPMGYFEEVVSAMSMIVALDKSYYDLLDRIERCKADDVGLLATEYIEIIDNLQKDYIALRGKYYETEARVERQGMLLHLRNYLSSANGAAK